MDINSNGCFPGSKLRHGNRKWTFWRCISYWKWRISIAMLVHQRVHALTSPCIDAFIYPTNLLGKFNGVILQDGKSSGEKLLLMEDILHHLGCRRPCKYCDIYHINWLAGCFSFNSMVGEPTSFRMNRFSSELREYLHLLFSSMYDHKEEIGDFWDVPNFYGRKGKNIFSIWTLWGQQYRLLKSRSCKHSASSESVNDGHRTVTRMPFLSGTQVSFFEAQVSSSKFLHSCRGKKGPNISSQIKDRKTLERHWKVL